MTTSKHFIGSGLWQHQPTENILLIKPNNPNNYDPNCHLDSAEYKCAPTDFFVLNNATHDTGGGQHIIKSHSLDNPLGQDDEEPIAIPESNMLFFFGLLPFGLKLKPFIWKDL
jgi:hypothetical protein